MLQLLAKRNATTIGLTLAALLAFSTVVKVAAQESSRDDSAFKLKVIRTESGAAAGDGSHNSSGNTFSSLSQDDLGNGVDANTTKSQTYLGQAQKGTADVPAAGKKLDGAAEEAVTTGETGVDWTTWINALGDRWFDALKNMEYRSHKQFNTKRTALIKFTCLRSGQIVGIRLYQGCGDPAYDAMQIESLKRIMPLAPFPEGSKRSSYTLQLGWEAHPRLPGQQDFEKGSLKIPVEKVKQHSKIN